MNLPKISISPAKRAFSFFLYHSQSSQAAATKMQSNKDSWWWEEDQIFHEEQSSSGEEEGNSLQQNSNPQPLDHQETENKVIRKSTSRPRQKITSERLLSTPTGFKYIRTAFSKVKRRLKGTREHLKDDLEVILEFYNEWLHHLQPKYAPEVVALQVERECRSRVMRAYFNRVKGLLPDEEFDETSIYAVSAAISSDKSSSNAQENVDETLVVNVQENADSPVVLSEEMQRRIAQNRFEAQERLLRRMEQLQQTSPQ